MSMSMRPDLDGRDFRQAQGSIPSHRRPRRIPDNAARNRRTKSAAALRRPARHGSTRIIASSSPGMRHPSAHEISRGFWSSGLRDAGGYPHRYDHVDNPREMTGEWCLVGSVAHRRLSGPVANVPYVWSPTRRLRTTRAKGDEWQHRRPVYGAVVAMVTCRQGEQRTLAARRPANSLPAATCGCTGPRPFSCSCPHETQRDHAYAEHEMKPVVGTVDRHEVRVPRFVDQ